jgi:hypothetical protein
MLLLAVGDILLLAPGRDDLHPALGQDDLIPALGRDDLRPALGEVILPATGDITTEGILISFSQAQYSWGRGTRTIHITRTTHTTIQLHQWRSSSSLRNMPTRASSSPITGTTAKIRKGTTRTYRAARVGGCR